MAGCVAFDCFGAGQHVTQVTMAGVDWRESPGAAERVFDVFGVMRQLHELAWYLTEALALAAARPVHAELRAALDGVEALTREPADALLAADVAGRREAIGALLGKASELARAGVEGGPRRRERDRRGADLAGAELHGQDLRGTNLRGALLIGADLRRADLRRRGPGRRRSPRREPGRRRPARNPVRDRVPAGGRDTATRRRASRPRAPGRPIGRPWSPSCPRSGRRATEPPIRHTSLTSASEGSSMSISENLIANESVVIEAKKHWIAPARDSLIAAGMILLGLFLWYWNPSGDGILGFLWAAIAIARWVLLIGGIAWIVYNIVVWRTAEFAVTNLRVLRYEGLVQRRSSETLLTSVSDVKLNVGIVGKSLGYGDLQIFTQSGDAGADSFTSITKPAEFRNAMMTVKLQDQVASRPAPAPGTCARRHPRPHPSHRPRRPRAPRTRRRASSGWRSCGTRASSRPRSSRPRRRRSSPGCRSCRRHRRRSPTGRGGRTRPRAADRAPGARRTIRAQPGLQRGTGPASGHSPRAGPAASGAGARTERQGARIGPPVPEPDRSTGPRPSVARWNRLLAEPGSAPPTCQDYLPLAPPMARLPLRALPAALPLGCRSGAAPSGSSATRSARAASSASRASSDTVG